MKEANSSFWKNCEEWSFIEAFYLLRGLEPSNENIPVDSSLYPEWKEWCAWAERGFPEFHTPLADGMASRLSAKSLLEWSDSLEHVDIHEMWDELYEKADAAEPELGEKERENLLATIGMLAVTLANSTGPKTGKEDKLNVLGIAKLCGKVVGNPTGLGESTVRNRIKEGVYALKNKQKC